MAKIHTLTYNGTKSSDLGVFVSGSGSFDAAEFDVDKYEIPGRNGDLILSNNRYKNIEITYPAFIPKAFMDKVQNVRNWLRSSKVYARLEDTYDMDHYRLGIPTGVQSFSPENRNDGANFEMTFDCKPQRFLKVGETPETVEAETKTASGEIASFDSIAVVPMTSAEVSLSPIQDLNGYDSPWPAGGGKNKLPPLSAQSTMNGVTFTPQPDGSVKCTGTANGFAYCTFPVVSLPAGSYVLSGASGWGTGTTPLKRIILLKSGSTVVADYGSGATFNLTETTAITARIDFGSGATTEVTAWPMIRAAGTDASFAPYSNICPISGHSGAELIRTGKNLLELSNESNPNRGSYSYSSETPQKIVATKTAGGGTFVARFLASLKANVSYTLSADTNNILRVYVYSDELWGTSVGTISTPFPKTFTPTKDGTYVFGFYGSTVIDTVQSVENAMLRLSSDSDATYEPYDGDTYSVTFTDQGTVYGGTFDFVSGKLVVEWVNIASYNGETITEPWLSSMDVYSAGATPTTGAQVVYKLVTPIEYTLSPQQLTTLLGENNVWGSGPITLTYAEPYNLDNPTLFDARPLFAVTNPAEGDVIMVNGQAITFVDGYAGTVFIDCETMNAYSGAANLNSIIQATDFPVLVPGTNTVTWTGAGECTMTPRWWEL